MTIEFSRQEKLNAARVEFGNAEAERGARLTAFLGARSKLRQDREALEAAEARSAAALKALMEAER